MDSRWWILKIVTGIGLERFSCTFSLHRLSITLGRDITSVHERFQLYCPPPLLGGKNCVMPGHVLGVLVRSMSVMSRVSCNRRKQGRHIIYILHFQGTCGSRRPLYHTRVYWSPKRLPHSEDALEIYCSSYQSPSGLQNLNDCLIFHQFISDFVVLYRYKSDSRLTDHLSQSSSNSLFPEVSFSFYLSPVPTRMWVGRIHAYNYLFKSPRF